MKTLVRSVLLLLVTVGFAPVVLAAGDAAKGKALYNICSACHGANAEGTAALNAPANAGQDPWYMTRQLKNFRAAIALAIFKGFLDMKKVIVRVDRLPTSR